MKKLSGVIFIISIFLIGGIADGINEGAPLSTAWWCIPILLVMWVSSRVFEEE